MANKNDVELVLRAKDQTSKAVDDVTKALKALTDVQDQLGKSAKNSAGLSEQLGSGIAKLKTEIGGLSQLGAAAESINKAGEAVARLSDTVSRSKGATSQLITEYGKAASRTRELQSAADAASKAFEQQKTSTAAAKDALAIVNAEVKDAESEYRRLYNAVSKAKQPSEQLVNALRDQRDTLISLYGAQQNAQAVYDDMVKAQTSMRTASDEAAAALKVSKKNQDELRDSAVKASQTLQTERAELGRLRTDLAAVTAQGEKTAQALGATKFTAIDTTSAVQAKQQLLELATATQQEAQKEVAAAEMRRAAQAEQTRATVASARAQMQFGSSLQEHVDQLRKFAGQLRSAAGEQEKLTAATVTGSAAQRSAYETQRTALSLFQRLRGQILSITAAYIGLFGAINELRNVTRVIRDMEQTQARFSVVFGDDTRAITSEMAYMREQAVRLGQDFGTLSKTYSDLLFASREAGFSLGETRRLFLAVSGAARVNQTSAEDLEGVYRALSQMLSKGSITAEELKQQLGDRMTGAFQLFAAGLGKTTEELNRLMQAGQVKATSKELLGFADQIQRKFGGALPAALSSTSAEIDRFFTLLDLARAKFADGGFGEALRKSLAQLNQYLQSSEGDKFFKALGEAAAAAVDFIRLCAEKFEVFVAVGKVWLSLRLAEYVVSMGKGFLLFGSRVTLAAANLAQLISFARVGALTIGGFFTALRAALVPLGAALGPTGLIAAGIFLIIELTGKWTKATISTGEALDKHRQTVETIKNAYSDAAQGVEDWKKRLEGLSEVQIRINGEALKQDLANLKKQIEGPMTLGFFPRGGGGSVENQIRAVIGQFQVGVISAKRFKAELEKIAKWNPPEIKVDEWTSWFQLADDAIKLEDAIAQVEPAAKAAAGGMDQATAAANGLADAVQNTNKQLSEADVLARYESAVNQLKDGIPALKAELEFDAAIKSVEQLVKSMKEIGLSPAQLAEIERLANLRIQSIQSDFAKDAGGGNFNGSAVDLIKKFEGFISNPKWDVNAYRAGYGSDTVTLADGSVQKITQGMKVSQADALRDLVRRIGEFQDIVRAQIGSERWNAMSEQQQAALTSIAYNYGELPNRIVNAVKTGTAQEMAAAVRGLAGDNGGINAGRRNAEADILAQGSNGMLVQQIELEQKKLENQQKFQENRDKEIAQQKFEIEQQGIINSKVDDAARQVAINTAVREAENRAIEAGVTYTEEMRQADAKRAAELYDATNGQKDADERRRAALDEVNRLTERQKLLMEQMQMLQDSGNASGAEAVKVQIQQTNDELLKAIENAQKLNNELGGPDAQNTDLDLQNRAMAVRKIGEEAAWSGERINDMLASGLTSAFDRFSEAVANGANVFKSLRDAFLQFAADFLREIAQMIMKQAIMNALGGGKDKSGGAGGFISSLIGNLFHDGGVVGQATMTRSVSPAIFQNAMRYHTGGIAGLQPNEVPAILKKGEEVLTQNDPRHIANGGGQQPVNVKVVNAIDPGEFISSGLDTTAGEKSILNFIRNNQSAVRSAMGV